ncbi:cytochrome C biogenesis protein [Rhodoferax koreense]|uniref:Cytochrome C biogenesis protein n=1 Tax=Rhodoferax koreensis TaxID=1842727 RepID=A0A1P8JSW2_9BURK|nr:cytochrome C biogenesis protein [Rhodoferax koreense]
MMAFILSYLGGALTILAPCILPVLPFVFARADQPFTQSGLPLLAGMALAFTGVATLGAVAGHWAVEANEYGRFIAMALLAVAGLSLLLPRLAQTLAGPFVALGSRLANGSDGASNGASSPRGPAAGSFVLGLATGLLWTPCAGPILGLILTAAAIQGPSLHTSLLLLAYAAGALSSLALALIGGGRLLARVKRFSGHGEWVRKGIGAAVLAGVGAIALGLDTGALAEMSSGGAIRLEKALFDRFKPAVPAAPERAGFMTVAMPQPPAASRLVLPVEGRMQPLDGVVEWLNSPPLTAEQLHGKVVLVDFWTFGCINCRNALPYVREWHRKYKDQGLVVIGVHAPEFAFEKNLANVKRAVRDLGVQFPVAVDNNFAVWRAFNNQYWPAHYFIDAKGNIRFHHFGEGEYEKSEQVIRQLLEEAHKENTTS